MKFFMTERRFAQSIDEAMQRRTERDSIWSLQSKVEDLQYKVQDLENRVHDLESQRFVPPITPTWSDKTIPIEKTDITCKGE